MSVQGLTTFIEKFCFFEKYRLHDTKLVIDGDSISRQLYVIHSTYQHTSFESNYDLFEDYVDSFFEMLAHCKIIPYVVFEGGVRNQQSKLKKLSERLQHVRNITNNLLNETEVYFPLFMRDVFENTVRKWNFKAVRCDFESYSTVVSVAKSLNCPVLSNESDYFICPDITYIPFQTLSKSGRKTYPYCSGINEIDKPIEPFIRCAKLDVKHFLKYLRLTIDKLPLLAVMLGPYDSEYANYKYLWPDNLNFQDLVIKVAAWISNRSIETAFDHILILSDNRVSKMKLQQKYDSFTCFKSRYLVDLEICSNEDLPENVREIENDDVVSAIPYIFLENFRKYRYSPYLMDMYIENSYYGLKPQMENLCTPHSHIWSEKIVGAIHKILTSSTENLSCFVRAEEFIVRKEVPLCNLDVPSFTEIQEMDVDTRKSIILKVLGLDYIRDALREFSESWQLFVTTILYLQKLSSLTLPMCYSVVLCKIILSYVDSKNHRLFRCKDQKFNYNKQSKRKSNLSLPKMQESEHTIRIAKEMMNFINYFQNSEDIRVSFDVNMLHGMSQFESCLFHIKLLNDLLNMPFENIVISDCFNGSFIYNFSKILQQSPTIDDFIKISLKQESPIIIDELQTIIGKIAVLK